MSPQAPPNGAPQGPPVFPPPLHPDDLGRGPAIMGITWTLTILCIITVALRVSSRRKAAGGIASDDWLMVVTLLVDIVSQVFITIAYTHGLGKQDANLWVPDEALNVAKWSWMATAPGMIVSVLGRISAAILLIRLFGIRPMVKWLFIVITVLLTVGHIVMLTCVWVQHTPVEGLWNPFLPGVKSWDHRIVLYMMYVVQSLCTFSDIAYVFVPVAIIWKLQMPLLRRLGLVAVMGASLFTAAMSILKTVTATNGGKLTPNAGYNASLSLLYVFIEQSFVIILGCVPALYKGARTEILAFWRLAGSMTRLLPSRGSTSAKRSEYYNRTGGSSQPYEDLEMKSSKSGNTGNGVYVTEVDRKAASAHSGSREDLVRDKQEQRVRAA